MGGLSLKLYEYEMQQLASLPEEQSGKILYALVCSELGQPLPEFDAIETVVFNLIKAQTNRAKDLSEKRSNAGKQNGANSDKDTSNESKPETKNNKDTSNGDTNTITITSTNTTTSTSTGETANDAGASTPPASGKSAVKRHKHGEYGWVLLSDDEYGRLIKDCGEDMTAYYIRYVDESAQKTKNKNGWKDWNLTVRNAIRDKWGGYNAQAPPSIKGGIDPALLTQQQELERQAKEQWESLSDEEKQRAKEEATW